jgi:hypothetical protein
MVEKFFGKITLLLTYMNMKTVQLTEQEIEFIKFCIWNTFPEWGDSTTDIEKLLKSEIYSKLKYNYTLNI